MCYLNSYGVDFRGGLFHFQDGEPATFIPMTGDVLMYTADSRNIHSVDEISDGERLTLTLWFTRDKSHDEDSKLISFLTRSPMNNSKEFDMFPLPASDNMYWFSLEQAPNYQSGFDLRCARIHVLGYDLYSSKVMNFSSAVDLSLNFSELLTEPLQLSRGNELFEKEFANVLHLLQVVHFYHWKVAELQTSEIKRKTNNIVPLSQLEREKILDLKLVLLKDRELAETVFGHTTCAESMNDFYDWDTFSAAVALWEAYIRKLIQEMHMHLPFWTTHQSLFSNPLLNLEERT